MIGGKKRDDDVFDDGSEISSDARTEGANAVAFSFPADGGGFIPHHKEPPRFIRVRAHDKKASEFNRVFLAQELVGTHSKSNDETRDNAERGAALHGYHKQDPRSGGPIWAVEFSKDGKYLATGGKDRVLRVWGVLATPEDRKAFEDGENASAPEGNQQQQQHLSAPVFHSKPIREFVAHTGDILDLSWSKNNFLLSSSMDRTVRLWHMSRPECLCTFKHNDFVTSISFHPRDDRFFLAGSLDATLRLWSIPDKSVAYSCQMTDIITAVAFSPDGKTAMAGCLNGLCMFYETVGLKYDTQIHVRSSRGKNARGSKITGIQTMSFPSDHPEGEVKILITSNDSRIRIYSMKDKTLEVKMKGHENSCNQIKASFSEDGKYIICGSEDRKAFIWSTDSTEPDKDDKRPYEYFEAHAHAVTEAVFAPTKTRQLLQSSNDPVYTLCNPPPIMLLSKEELETESLHPNDAPSDSPHINKPEESPAFIARSAHHDGNIIVTTDHSGLIKVFRQDCAFVKRRIALENWDAGSTFSRKVGKDGFLSRTVTRTSASVSSRDPTSRRASITQAQRAGVPQVNTDRIDLWRHGVHGHGHLHMGSAVSIPSSFNTATFSDRSASPSKAARSPMASRPASGVANNHQTSRTRQLTQSSDVSNTANGNGNGTGTSVSDIRPLSPTPSHSTGGGGGGRTDERPTPKDMSFRLPPTPSFSFRSLDDEVDGGGGGGGGVGGGLGQDPVGASPSFWKMNRWRNNNTGGSGSGSGHRNGSGGASSGLGIFPSGGGGGGQKGQQNGNGDTAAPAVDRTNTNL